jgi:hypothetical protein
MKNKLLKLVLPDFFRQRIHSKDLSGNVLKLVKPESEQKRTESLIDDILRWADHGGPMILGTDSSIARSNSKSTGEQTDE